MHRLIERILRRSSSESWKWSLLEPEVRAALDSQITRELARRSLSGAMVYAIMCVLVAWSTRFWVEHPAILGATTLLTFSLGLIRILMARRLLRDAQPSRPRHRLVFIGTIYASFVVWGVFCGWTVYLYAAQWPAMFLLLSTAALSGGATSSLAPNLRMGVACLVLMFVPTIAASVAEGGRPSLAVALAGTLYLVFLVIQLRDNWHSFWGATVAAERERLNRSSDRRRAELERASLVTAIEQAAEEIIITDARGDIRYCNPSFERATGYRKLDVIGHNPRFLKSGRHDQQFYGDLWSTIVNGGVWAGRLTNRRKDGTLYDTEGTISPIHDLSGRLTGFVSARHDVTERLRLEQQLAQAQKMESIGRLAGGVAHDFNNLLTVIGGYSGVLCKALPAGDARRNHAVEIAKAAQRAASLTRQLLTVSRRQIIRPKPVDLNALVVDMQGMLQRLVGEDVEIVVDAALRVGLVQADPDQLHQVLMNLVANARDAMPRGGQIRIATAHAEMPAHPAAEDAPAGPRRSVLLTVSDSGVGIDEQTMEHIFEPFFTTKDKAQGTGLGLSTVYSIIEQADGAIEVSSQPGRGTTFSIYLPRMESPAIEPPAAEATLASLTGSETVLVVEDHEDVRQLIAWTLKSRGFRILEAANGPAAVTQFSTYPGPIDLLVTDVIMPGMTGREVADQLAASRPGVKVLFISGYSGEVIAHRGVLDASVAYLAKPFTPEELVAKVRDVLGSGAESHAHHA